MKLPSLPLPLGSELVYSAPSSSLAGVVELVDTGDSKSPAGNSLPVQVRPPVPIQAAEFISYLYILGCGVKDHASQNIVALTLYRQNCST